jgi:hypothetical protein
VRVIPPAEDLMIVNHVARLLAQQEEQVGERVAVLQ